MKPFTLENPATAVKAVEQFQAARGTVAYKAGGTDLLDAMKHRILSPDSLINLLKVEGLDRLEPEADGGLRIGASVTLARLADHPLVRERFQAVAAAAGEVATPQIRNVATLGGNLCQSPRCWYYRQWALSCYRRGGRQCEAVKGEHRFHAVFGEGVCHMAHPSTVAPALIAIEASVNIRGKNGVRKEPMESFYRTPKLAGEGEWVLGEGELVESVVIPNRGWRSAFYAIRERQGPDWPLAMAAVALKLEKKVVADCRIVLGAVAPIPWRVKTAERALVGHPLAPESFIPVAQALDQEARPLAGNQYKVRLAQVALKRAVMGAVAGE